jgi:hypothetical protein
MNIGFEVSSFFLGTAFKRELYQFVQICNSTLCFVLATLIEGDFQGLMCLFN